MGWPALDDVAVTPKRLLCILFESNVCQKGMRFCINVRERTIMGSRANRSKFRIGHGFRSLPVHYGRTSLNSVVIFIRSSMWKMR
jgi:hypothetical protein